MSEQQFHDEVMAELEQQYNKKKIAIDFESWLYKNYMIGNGHTLIRLQEDSNVVDKFFKDAGLPVDTEF